jgi:hypothetical protein
LASVDKPADDINIHVVNSREIGGARSKSHYVRATTEPFQVIRCRPVAETPAQQPQGRRAAPSEGMDREDHHDFLARAGDRALRTPPASASAINRHNPPQAANSGVLTNALTVLIRPAGRLPLSGPARESESAIPAPLGILDARRERKRKSMKQDHQETEFA